MKKTKLTKKQEDKLVKDMSVLADALIEKSDIEITEQKPDNERIIELEWKLEIALEIIKNNKLYEFYELASIQSAPPKPSTPEEFYGPGEGGASIIKSKEKKNE